MSFADIHPHTAPRDAACTHCHPVDIVITSVNAGLKGGVTEERVKDNSIETMRLRFMHFVDVSYIDDQDVYMNLVRTVESGMLE
jgi:hypothetical protein